MTFLTPCGQAGHTFLTPCGRAGHLISQMRELSPTEVRRIAQVPPVVLSRAWGMGSFRVHPAGGPDEGQAWG